MSIDTCEATITPVPVITPLVTYPVVMVFESLLDVILPESTLMEYFSWY